MYRVNFCLWKSAFLFIFIAAGFFQTVNSSNIIRTNESNSATLKFIGHAFVKISTVAGKTIYIDPFNVNEFADSADIVLITHEHGDHNDLSRIIQKASCQVIRSASALQGDVYQNFVIDDIKIKAVPAYNANHSKSVCVGYVVEFDSIKVYHAGDTGKIPEMADLASQNIDYALLPMDGIYTMTPEEATEAAVLIQAKHDIPIHTMPPPDKYNMEIVDRFTSPNKLVVIHGETIELAYTTTSVEENFKKVDGFSLRPNYPNPFNLSTTIKYNLQKSCRANLKIYNLSGQELETLVNSFQTQGEHAVIWQSKGLASGIYFYRLQIGDPSAGSGQRFSETKKLILHK